MRMRLSLDAGAFGSGLGGRDDGVRFCVGLRLERKARLGSVDLIVRGSVTYVPGLGLDAGNGEDTLLLLDLVAVFPIDVLWDR